MSDRIIKEDDRYAALKLDNQLCFPLYAASRLITNRYTPILKPLNLTYTQYLVMLVLWEEGSCTVSKLCSRLYLDCGTISPLLKKLEAAGYVEKIRSCEDERCVSISLTEKGKELREKALDIPGKVGSCMSLSRDDAVNLYKTLHNILNAEEKDMES